jgi:multiple sugar transport system substrate-binding protein
LLALTAAVAILATACNSAASPNPSSAAPTTAASQASLPAPTPLVTAAPIDTSEPGPNGGVVVRWFVGLGAGGQPLQIAAQTTFVTDYNNSQKDVYISLEIYDNKVAGNILKTQIAAGNAPDIIGPVGVEGLNLFIDQLADLQPQIDSTGYDMSKYPDAMKNFFKIGKGGATIGVPFGTYPSFLWYNKKLFDEANLPYPPTKVGDSYQGKPWDVAAVREIGMKLTVDRNGNDATNAAFDASNIVQWGFDSQWADNSPTAETALFGASSFLASDGKSAQIPDPLRAGIHWFNDGVWKDHFIPTQNQVNSDLLAKGNPFSSGNLAMVEIHTWYSCCVNPAAPAKPIVGDAFGWAVAPAYNGKTTAKLHADTFSMLKTTKHADAAFKALSALAASGSLATIYGALPADETQQQPFIDSVNKAYPGAKLDWSVPTQMLANPDIPNHQAWVPDYAKSKAAWQAFGVGYRTNQSADIDKDLDTLKTTLQGIFDAAPDKNP